MSKQSSVEWLYEQLTLTWYDYESGKDILQQAKEMEKQQITEDYRAGVEDERYNHLKLHGDYYNETYGGNK